MRTVCSQNGSVVPNRSYAPKFLNSHSDHHCPWLASTCIVCPTHFRKRGQQLKRYSPGTPNIPGIHPLYLLLHAPSHLRRYCLRTCNLVLPEPSLRSCTPCLLLLRRPDFPIQDVYTPIHELCLTLAGIIFALVMGSFFLYHVYLVLYVRLQMIHKFSTAVAAPTRRLWRTYLRFLS
jgi:hypothetical protein